MISKEAFGKLKEKFPEIVSYPVNKKEVKLAAGWLIDQAGWKGKTTGNCGVHENQALVLVNYGGSSGSEIHQFSKTIQKAIKFIFNIDLESEVNII